jgi:hypothetical protein
MRLASVLERRRGGVEGCFAARVSSSSSCSSRSYTIFEGGDYESRFEMSKSRYKELTAALRFNEPQANTVDKVLLRGCLQATKQFYLYSVINFL